MKSKKIPMRMCIGCRAMKPKRELLRIVRSAAGTVDADLTGRAPGRGAYICRDAACLEKAIKIHAIHHALGEDLPEGALDTLREALSVHE